MDTVDAVAQAIFIENSGPAVELTEYFEPCPDWDEVPEGTRDYYRRLARAAIDAHTAALGLTEQWGTSPDNTDAEGNPLYEPKGPVTHGDTESQAREHAARFNGHPWSRLVSGWVRKGNTNE